MTARCELITYVSAGVTEDGALEFLAECDGPVDCGWEVDLDATKVNDSLDVDSKHPGLNNLSFPTLHQWHIEHSTTP